MGDNKNECKTNKVSVMKFIDDFFECFYKNSGFGPEEYKIPVPEESIKYYKGRLPDTLLSYWKEYGWCSYAQGMLKLVNPKEYESIVDLWLKDTPFSNSDKYHLIALGAFGDMVLWGEKNANDLSINATYGLIFYNDKSKRLEREDGYELSLKILFVAAQKEDFDLEDNNGNYLFEKTKALYGKLYPDEIYGFAPALAMGGECSIKHLKKMNAKSYLTFLAELGSKNIVGYDPI